MKTKLNCILLIDDDEPTNYFNQLVIEKIDCAAHIQTVYSGEEALDYLTNAGRFADAGTVYPRPELIFLDLNMPAMNGWEFLERYNNMPDEQKGNVVMVMLTTSLNPGDEIKAVGNPEIDGFIHKPLTAGAMDKILHRHFAYLFPKCNNM